MSMVYENIVAAIDEFDFSNYGLDEIEDTKFEDHARDWIHALAARIQEKIAR